MNASNPTLPDGQIPGNELVAYLDGELNAEERRQLEERLSTSPDLRQQLKELQQAWDLLDDLPREQVEDSFARTTVEMVAIHADAEADEKTRSIARRRTAAWCLAIVGTLVAATAGFWITNRELSEPNRKLVEDLPILEHLDAYQSADSIEFLQALEREGLFKGEESDGR